MESLNLREKIEIYKSITLEINNCIDLEHGKLLEGKLNQRQEIINSIKDFERKEANEIYVELNLHNIDEEIRLKIFNNMENIKCELLEYRKNKLVNFIYSRNSKEKLNIFSKKV